MKRFIKITWCLLFIILTVLGCTSEQTKEEAVESVEVKTLEVTNITSNTATVKANLTTVGDIQVSAVGICISRNQNPTIDGAKINVAVISGNFEYTFTNMLDPNTTYYVRAYVTTNSKTIYGNELSFITPNLISKVFTGQATSVTPTSATIGVTFENIKKLIVISSGVCLSTNANPTIADAQKTLLLDENYNTQNFNSNLGKLTPATKYYAKAYFETVFGIHFGEVISFTTKERGVPYIQTSGMHAFSPSVADVSAKILSNGGADIVEYGFCWSNIYKNPTLETDMTGKIIKTGAPPYDFFDGRMTDLLPLGNEFNVRAYAKNKYGVGYSPALNFKLQTNSK